MTAGLGRPLLLVLSGPSGAGKTTIAARLLADGAFRRAITATTRAPRGGERDGIDYHFLDEAEFARRVEAGRFLEHAEVYGRRYGTPRDGVEAVLAAGRHGLLVVDVQGVRTLRGALAGLPWQVRYVFVRAPSAEALARRLAARGEDDPEAVARRLAEAEAEEAEAAGYDLVLVNDEVEAAVALLGERVRGWTRAAGAAD